MTNQAASSQTFRKIAWLTTIPHLFILLALMLFIWQIFLPDDFLAASMYGAAAYLSYSFGSRSMLLRHHKKGVNLMKPGSYRDAIREFESSYQFLSNHSWIDRYRVITMLDQSAIPYREMALCNIGYSYVQLEEPALALQYYQRAQTEFPESELAQNGVEHVQGLLRA